MKESHKKVLSPDTESTAIPLRGPWFKGIKVNIWDKKENQLGQDSKEFRVISL